MKKERKGKRKEEKSYSIHILIKTCEIVISHHYGTG